jgi:lysophospholipase L1-like esterase
VDIAFTAQTVLQTGPALMNRVADAGPDSYLWLDLRNANRQATVQQLQISYRAPTGGEISIAVNDGPENQVTLPPSTESQTLTLHGDALISTVKMSLTQGQMVLQGFIIDHDKNPDVTLDVFGLPSATARGWTNVDPAYLASTLPDTPYDGVVLEYGTNEGNTRNFDPDKYADGLTKALTNMRAVFPNASCVLIGPPDRGVLTSRSPRKKHGRHTHVVYDFLVYARTHQKIEAIQRNIGARFSCTAWNWQALMGGPGGSYGWAHARPPLMGPDLTHLSRDGYKRSGEAFAQSMGWGKN